MFDSMTFRMKKEENKEAVVDDREEEKLVVQEVEGYDQEGGEDEQWSHALRLIFAQGYGIHGDHYDPLLLPSLLGDGPKMVQDRDSDQVSDKDIAINGSDKARHKDKGSYKKQDQGSGQCLHQDKDKGSGQCLRRDKGWVRLYSCQQSLMKMHPLFDHAIVKVINSHPAHSRRRACRLLPYPLYFTLSLLHLNRILNVPSDSIDGSTRTYMCPYPTSFIVPYPIQYIIPVPSDSIDGSPSSYRPQSHPSTTHMASPGDPPSMLPILYTPLIDCAPRQPIWQTQFQARLLQTIQMSSSSSSSSSSSPPSSSSSSSSTTSPPPPSSTTPSKIPTIPWEHRVIFVDQVTFLPPPPLPLHPLIFIPASLPYPTTPLFDSN